MRVFEENLKFIKRSLLFIINGVFRIFEYDATVSNDTFIKFDLFVYKQEVKIKGGNQYDKCHNIRKL
jgi:hypothetical protein